MSRREYEIDPIVVNRMIIRRIIIDPHYEEKHADSISDPLILKLVRELNGRIEFPEEMNDGFSYFVTLIELGGRQYRLIWLLEDVAIYIGIINAYRDDRKE